MVRNIALKKVIQDVIRIPEITILFPVMIVILVGISVSPKFLTISNIYTMIRNISYIGIVSIFMTFLLMSKGLDLSCDAVAGFCSIVFAYTMQKLSWSPIVCITTALALSAVIGYANGLLVTKVGIPSFVVTLGMLSIAKGATLILSNGSYIMIHNDFLSISNVKVLGISLDVYAFIIIAIIADILLRYTGAGRKIALLGTNASSAVVAGIRTVKITIILYVAIAVGTGFAALLFTFRSGIGMTDCGTSWALQAITACVIGGTSLYGGSGSILGTIFGVFFMGLLTNIMSLLSIKAEWQYVGIGLFMVLGIVLEVYRSNKLR